MKKKKKNINLLPVNIFFTINGLSPSGLSRPPSKLNPSPAPSLKIITRIGGPQAVSSEPLVSNPVDKIIK